MWRSYQYEAFSNRKKNSLIHDGKKSLIFRDLDFYPFILAKPIIV